MSRCCALAALLLGGACISRAAEKPPERRWGDLSGRFVCDCEKPLQPRLIEVTKDQEICGKAMQTESHLVNPRDGGLANVFVYLRLNAHETLPAIHPDYEKPATDKVPMDISKCRFVPHAVALRTTQTLSIADHDEVVHSPRVMPFRNSETGGADPSSPEQEYKFKLEESVPFKVGCDVRTWMTGWILVRDDPYFAVTDESGRFEIENLPVGEWTFQFWHERSGYLTDGKRNEQPESWPKGRLSVKIAAGRNDLGDLHLSPKLFEEK